MAVCRWLLCYYHLITPESAGVSTVFGWPITNQMTRPLYSIVWMSESCPDPGGMQEGGQLESSVWVCNSGTKEYCLLLWDTSVQSLPRHEEAGRCIGIHRVTSNSSDDWKVSRKFVWNWICRLKSTRGTELVWEELPECERDKNRLRWVNGKIKRKMDDGGDEESHVRGKRYHEIPYVI